MIVFVQGRRVEHRHARESAIERRLRIAYEELALVVGRFILTYARRCTKLYAGRRRCAAPTRRGR